MHRIDDGEGRTRTEAASRRIDRPQRRRRIHNDADIAAARQPRIAIEVQIGAEGRIGHDHAYPIAMAREQRFLLRRVGYPARRLDIAEQRRQPSPQRRLRGRGEGQCGHQRERAGPRHRSAAPRGHRLPDREHQPQRRIADRQAIAHPTEQLRRRLALERLHLGPIVAEHARRLDAQQPVGQRAEPGRPGGDQRKFHAWRVPDNGAYPSSRASLRSG